MGVATQENCPLCIELEVAKLLSLSLDFGIEPKTRDDVLNLIKLSDYSSINEDQVFTEDLIDAFLAAY